MAWKAPIIDAGCDDFACSTSVAIVVVYDVIVFIIVLDFTNLLTGSYKQLQQVSSIYHLSIDNNDDDCYFIIVNMASLFLAFFRFSSKIVKKSS